VRQGDLVTFVEVKTRRGKAFGSPLEAVTGAKRRELVKAARVWVDRFGKPADIYRFDCIAIVDSKLEHVADAFRPGCDNRGFGVYSGLTKTRLPNPCSRTLMAADKKFPQLSDERRKASTSPSRR